MAEGFSEFQSSEESKGVPSDASVDKEKSNEELLQEGSVTTGSGTDTEQLQDTIENLTSLNGGHEHGRLVHTVYSASNPVSDDSNGKFLILKRYDELVGEVATSSHLACQEIRDAQLEEKSQYLEANMQLELELGRRLFFDDKQKRNEKAYQSFRTHANEQIKSCSASGASCDFTGMEGKPFGGEGLLQEPLEYDFHLIADDAFCMDEDPVQEPNSAFHMEEAPEHEPRWPSTNPKILDRTTEVIPPRNHNLDTVPENPPKLSSADNVAEQQSIYKDGLATVEGDPTAKTRETGACMSEDQNGLLVTAAEGESQEHINLQEKESQECGTENQIPQDEFKKNSSYEGSLPESRHHSSIKNKLSSDASLPGASYMESMMNYTEADRIKPHTVDDEVASRPNEHNRLSLPLLVRQDERGYAVGGSTFEESLDGTTGPDCTQNSDHLPSTSVGNMAHVHVAAAGRSTCSGALNGVLSEPDSTAAHPYAPGNASSTCQLLNRPAGDQVTVVSEPCRAESANSRDSMSDRNTVTECNGINVALLVLAQRIHDICVASGERPIEGEQQREATDRAWNTRFQCQAEDFIMESLDSTPDSARALARREAVIRASTDEMRRGPSSSCRPGEHSCVCRENDGRQACCVHGTIVPERCQPDLAHDKCCKCLEGVFIGSKILPCSHRVHTECLVGMIQNDEVNCPICGHAFLGRG